VEVVAAINSPYFFLWDGSSDCWDTSLWSVTSSWEPVELPPTEDIFFLLLWWWCFNVFREVFKDFEVEFDFPMVESKVLPVTDWSSAKT
jgi:hypothetical protein